jgi:hypothetical protein
VTEQNHFQFDQQYYKQTEGLAMAAPTSAILAETYMQHMEHKQIYPILTKHKIIGYFRYVDDIIIYDQRKTNIEDTLIEFNKQKTNINFTIEKEEHNCINFLDLTIHRKKTKLEFAIYRKHTQTDIIIPNDSCHPYEHEIASINYLTNRLHAYPITNEAKIKELNIKNTLHNKYNINLDIKQHKKHNKIKNNDPQHQKTKWAIFTCSRKETRKITKLFRDTDIRIAFRILYLSILLHRIIGYFIYVDNILIIYDQRKINIDNTLIEFNEQKTNINFTIEHSEHEIQYKTQ